MAEWERMFERRLDARAGATESLLAEVPAGRGVVLLAGEAAQPIVLITAADMRRRTRSRLSEPFEDRRTKLPDLRGVTRWIYCLPTWSHFETDLRFLAAAQAIWPARWAKMPAWKPAWVVHVDPRARLPRFARTREAFGAAGEYLGPFGTARDAARFVDAVQDGFDLCRDFACLRRAPNAQPCAYAQMGRCLCPCDGTVPMEAYRRAVAEAAAYAAGDRRAARRRLEESMQAAAAELAFERAGRIKARLDRLAELDAPCFEPVRTLSEFRFVVVQPGRGRRQAEAFLVDRGTVADGGTLRWPADKRQLAALVTRMRRFAAAEHPQGLGERWRMGLVATYVVSSRRRRGLIVRWRESLTAGELAEAIESAAGSLGLGPRRRRRSRAAAGADVESPPAQPG